MKRNNKKGFTLAELLIVVAIIAVLVAIAVPLFVASLNKAQEAKDKANLRAVKSAAVVYILSLEKGDKGYDVVYSKEIVGSTEKAMADKIVATATIADNGDISNIALDKYDSQTEGIKSGTATVIITPVDVDPDKA